MATPAAAHSSTWMWCSVVCGVRIASEGLVFNVHA